MCLVYTPDGIILVSRYYITSPNLFFYNLSSTDLYLEAKVVGHAH